MAKRVVREKIWMVVQDWKIAPDCILPVRSMVKAKTARGAQTKAAESCEMAQKMMSAQHGSPTGEPAGQAAVLYAIGYADDPEFRKVAKQLK